MFNFARSISESIAIWRQSRLQPAVAVASLAVYAQVRREARFNGRGKKEPKWTQIGTLQVVLRLNMSQKPHHAESHASAYLAEKLMAVTQAGGTLDNQDRTPLQIVLGKRSRAHVWNSVE